MPPLITARQTLGRRDLMRAGRHGREHETAGFVGQRAQAERDDLDPGAFEQVAGGGVALDANGRMIDEAFARSARRILEIGK